VTDRWIDVELQLEEGAIAPFKGHDSDAGWDLHVFEDTFVQAGQYQDVKSGLRIAMPRGWYARIVGRSSALRKKGIIVVEGIIDAGFRGELFTCAYCPLRAGDMTFHQRTEMQMDEKFAWMEAKGGVQLTRGESIAQLIFQPVPGVSWREVSELVGSSRGEAGFGSTGR
jgi:dUTP pyrophosphatase